MLFDTHAHLNFAAFNHDREEVIEKCLKKDIWLINVGTNYETSKKAIEIAEKYPEGVYAAIGLHPINLEEDFDEQKYRNLAKSKKVVAIGEIGLDYYYKPKTKRKLEIFKQKQRELLFQELKLADELNLPVIFHCRMAHNDLLEILNTKYKTLNTKFRGVIHCFTGTWEQAQKYLEMGFYLGFNGIIFKLSLDEIIEKTPLDRILIETDCPYLTPPLPAEALAKAGRNEPIFVKYIAEYIAKIRTMPRFARQNLVFSLCSKIKNLSFEKICKITSQNAKNLFLKI